MKRLWAGVITIALMGLLLWTGAGRVPSTTPDESTPVATSSAAANPAGIDRSWLAGEHSAGDVSQSYLDAFAGELKDRLSRQVAERGRAAFADDLRKAASARKSHAVFAAEADGLDAAIVTVEAVYPDRNERQTYRVESTASGWLVTRVETIKSHQPPSKFGTPAAYLAPEGPPVPGGVNVETGDDPNSLP